mmetsp:Transcript_5092/g.11573  ORF Transcript_5092/g.11573 Transcript_5092/m.11573 type:complete len:234 (+) Transcript_5092:1376-2077(+)
MRVHARMHSGMLHHARMAGIHASGMHRARMMTVGRGGGAGCRTRGLVRRAILPVAELDLAVIARPRDFSVGADYRTRHSGILSLRRSRRHGARRHARRWHAGRAHVELRLELWHSRHVMSARVSVVRIVMSVVCSVSGVWMRRVAGMTAVSGMSGMGVRMVRRVTGMMRTRWHIRRRWILASHAGMHAWMMCVRMVHCVRMMGWHAGRDAGRWHSVWTWHAAAHGSAWWTTTA